MTICTHNNCENRIIARGLCHKHYKRLRTHGRPDISLTAERGKSISPLGYKIYANKLEHRRVAEMALGKHLPEKAVVHHVDYNKLNNSPNNLVICSASYHKIIHQRTDAYNATGDANKIKCTICGEYDDKENMYVQDGRFTGYHNSCRREAKRNSPNYRGRKNWVINAFGKAMTLHEWAAVSGINRTTIATRIKELKWTNEDAVSKPTKKQALKDGHTVPGCHLEAGTHLRIR